MFMYRFFSKSIIILLLFFPIGLFSNYIETKPYWEDIYGKNYFEYFYEQQDEIEKLKKENQELREMYGKFNHSTEQYIKILSERKIITDEKQGAYNQALNSIKWWFWVISFIIWWAITFLSFLGYKEWKSIRSEILKKVKSLYNESLSDERSLLIGTTKELEDRVNALESPISRWNRRRTSINTEEDLNVTNDV